MWTDENFSDAVPIQNVLKGATLLLLLYNSALWYAIRGNQENQARLKPVYTDDGNLLGDDINIIKQNVELYKMLARRLV